jgi:polyphosphate kinase
LAIRSQMETYYYIKRQADRESGHDQEVVPGMM